MYSWFIVQQPQLFTDQRDVLQFLKSRSKFGHDPAADEGGIPVAATIGEVRAAFSWPTAFTTAGSLVVAAVILASPLTSLWPTSRRYIAFATFALLVLATCTVCGHYAGSRVASILR